MNIGIVINIVNLSLIILSIFMLPSLCIAFFYKTSEIYNFFISFLITFLTGSFLFFFTRKYKELRYREAFASITFTWIGTALFGSLPYLLTGTLNSFTDAFLKQYQVLQLREQVLLQTWKAFQGSSFLEKYNSVDRW
ncbi:MAG: hypothetical protein C0190_01680 [Thermodesulfobacterium geofontis]|uniref:Uncharacterized protein n=1 Tax=Thermodesulfobacterium geofontis TaxID=1295609 RepID=A0A2N7PPV6_9BACT|nr:MAG: hypothetical protein C0190_01680 [Thermodesulfobacterium geofontis]